MDPSPAIEECVRSRASKLELHCPRLRSCHATIDSRHRHKTHGRRYRVRIELGVPREAVAVAGDDRNEDAKAAVNAAFAHALG